MSYASQLAALTAPGTDARNRALRDDCVEVSGYGCDECPLIGRCVIHRAMLRHLDRQLTGAPMHFVRHVQLAKRQSASFVRVAEGICTYAISQEGAGSIRHINVPADIATNQDRLGDYLRHHFAEGTSGVGALCG